MQFEWDEAKNLENIRNERQRFEQCLAFLCLIDYYGGLLEKYAIAQKFRNYLPIIQIIQKV